jgi:hypothetical protein
MQVLKKHVKGISRDESEGIIALCAKFTEETVRHGSYQIVVYGGRIMSISSTRKIGVKVVGEGEVPTGQPQSPATDAGPVKHPFKGITKDHNHALLNMCKQLTGWSVMYGEYGIEVSGGKVSSVGCSRSVKVEVMDTLPAGNQPETKAAHTAEGETP